MKNIKMNLVIRTVMLVAMTAVATGTLFGQDSKGGKLVGTWDAVVTIRDCNSGAALNTFPSIASFNQGGTSIGSTSGIPQANRTPEHSVWRHVRGHMYQFTFKTFSFSPTGAPVGYAIVTHDLELDRGGDTYTSAGIAQIFLMNGVQVAQGCSDAVGARFGF
ncbi:hypothetical protein BH20ACI2_BH20ACI2_29270 [soil metagenome]